MAKMKSLENIQARKAFAAEADTGIGALSLEQSFTDLKRMDLEDLVYRLEQVDNQATLIKWRILWEIRQRFSSDKLFGQYIAELKASSHALCVGNQQEINRAIHAGRFCEKHKITDLTSIGISQTAIYALSRPMNDDVSSDVFKAIKHKGYPIAEVERRLAQAKALPEVEQKPEVIDYEPKQEEPTKEPYTIIVENGVAQVRELIEHEPEENPAPEMAEVMHRHESVSIMREVIEEEGSSTDEDIINAILKFISWYKLSPMKMISLLQTVIRRIQAETYRSQS